MINFLKKKITELKVKVRYWFLWEKSETIKIKKPKKNDTFGSHYSLQGVLDHLDTYHECMRALKKHNPDAYDLYHQIGGVLYSDKSMFSNIYQELEPAWRIGKFRPTFALVYFPFKTDGMNNYSILKMAYFTKIDAREHVQFEGGDIYEVCVYYTNEDGGDSHDTFYTSVDSAGNTKTLKVRVWEHNKIKRRKHSKGGSSSIPQKRWMLPPFLKFISEDQTKKLGNDVPPEVVGDWLFRTLANGAINSIDGFMVSAYRSGVSARFYIDMLRTPYFFKDRIKVKTKNGNTKPIFHIVRTHERKRGNHVRYVKTHFRGMRRVDWNGYKVTISMPGKHHRLVEDLNATAVYEDEVSEASAKYLSNAELGREMSRHIGAAGGRAC